MKCSIERLISNEDIAWIVSVDNLSIGELIIQFALFEHNKISVILLEDEFSKHRLRIGHKKAGPRSKDHPINLMIDDYPIYDVGEWLNSVLSLLFDIYINGWSLANHIDWDFYKDGKCITISFYVNPPS